MPIVENFKICRCANGLSGCQKLQVEKLQRFGSWGGALSGTSLLLEHQKQTHTNPTQLRDGQHPEPHAHSWVKAHTGQDVQHTWSPTYPLPHHWLLLRPQGHTRRHSGRRWDSLSRLAGSCLSSVIWETYSLRKGYPHLKKDGHHPGALTGMCYFLLNVKLSGFLFKVKSWHGKMWFYLSMFFLWDRKWGTLTTGSRARGHVQTDQGLGEPSPGHGLGGCRARKGLVNIQLPGKHPICYFGASHSCGFHTPIKFQ